MRATNLFLGLSCFSGCAADVPIEDPDELETSLTSAELDDFLTPDVCDVGGQAVYGDPAACPAGAGRRRLRVGERLPYFRVDQLGAQGAVTFPAYGVDGAKIWIATYDWGPKSPYVGADGTPLANPNGTSARQAYLETTTPDSSPGGYDIMDSVVVNDVPGTPTSGWVAFSATDVYHWIDQCATRGVTGGWLLFPRTATAGGTGTLISTLGLSRLGDACAAPASVTSTTWHRQPMRYTSGKLLETIWVDHACNVDGDPGNDCFERHWFTKEYGLTRWERWDSTQRVPPPATPNPMGCNGAWQSGHLWRRFCRDFATVQPVPQAGSWNPRVYPLAKQVGRGNLLKNGDLAARSASGWKNHSTATSIAQRRVVQEPTTANHRLYFACTNAGGCSVSQDLARDAIATSSPLVWGADVTATAPATATLALYQIDDRTGTNLVVDTQLVSLVPGTILPVVRSIPARARTTRIRWQLFVHTPGVEVILDDMFVTNW